MTAPATLPDAVEAAVGPLDELDPDEALALAARLRAIADALPGATPHERRQGDALHIAADLVTGAE